MKFTLCLFVMLLTGCVSFDNVAESELPAPWRSALRQSAKTPESFSGFYANAGEAVIKATDGKAKGMAKRPTIDAAHLALVLSADSRTGVPYEPSSATTVELAFTRPNTVELIARRDAVVIARRTFESSWDDQAHALILLDDTKPAANRSVGGVAVGRQSLRLFKGSDGSLYVRQKRAMVGTVLAIVPVATGEETWARYAPAPSEALQTRPGS